jgi:hypothetical protein
MYKFRRRLIAAATILVGITMTPISALAQESNAETETSDVSQALPSDGTVSEEQLAWQAALESGTSPDVFAFIEAYPNGEHIKDAKALMIDLLWLELADDSPTPDVVTSEAEDASAVSQEIELRSVDGLVALNGVIIDFDDALITIQTSTGSVGIENDGIECFGAACPDELRADP